jgi:guanylate kinase
LNSNHFIGEKNPEGVQYEKIMHERKLIILCGPSGSGKTTLAQHLLSKMPELSFSISATTRNKRGEE